MASFLIVVRWKDEWLEANFSSFQPPALAFSLLIEFA